MVWENPLEKQALKYELIVHILPERAIFLFLLLFLLPANPEFSAARMDFFCSMKEKQQAKGKYL